MNKDSFQGPSIIQDSLRINDSKLNLLGAHKVKDLITIIKSIEKVALDKGAVKNTIEIDIESGDPFYCDEVNVSVTFDRLETNTEYCARIKEDLQKQETKEKIKQRKKKENIKIF